MGRNKGDVMASPYRADHVGSLLRPPELLQARADFEQHRISAEQLEEAENAAVLKALAMEREAGIDIYTDGEYRRGTWSGIITESIDGLVPDENPPARRILRDWQGPHGQEAISSMAALRPVTMVVGAKLRQTKRLTSGA